MVPELEEKELEKTVQPMVLEYFEHGDTLEVVVSLSRSSIPQGLSGRDPPPLQERASGPPTGTGPGGGAGLCNQQRL